MSKYVKALPCILCGTPSQDVDDQSRNLPYKATCFVTQGHYGSTSFDPMDGSSLEIVICDECLLNAAGRELVYHVRGARPVWKEGWGVVGWLRVDHPEYALWDPKEEAEFMDIIFSIDDEDIDNIVSGVHPLANKISFNVTPESIKGKPE